MLPIKVTVELEFSGAYAEYVDEMYVGEAIALGMWDADLPAERVKVTVHDREA